MKDLHELFRVTLHAWEAYDEATQILIEEAAAELAEAARTHQARQQAEATMYRARLAVTRLEESRRVLKAAAILIHEGQQTQARALLQTLGLPPK